MPRPSVKDYTKYLTLRRCQGPYPRGGCFICSSLHVLDALNKKNQPFTPDMSQRFAFYAYWQICGLRADSRLTKNWNDFNDKNMNDLRVLEKIGACPEAACLTDFDVTAAIPLDANYQAASAPLLRPSDTNIKEASRYRIASYSDEQRPPNHDIEKVKEWLWLHGPLIMYSYFKEHVVALFGYDDAAQRFTYVDSGYGSRGFPTIAYADFATRLKTAPTLNPPEDIRFRWIVYKPPTNPEPFTGRVSLSSREGRRFITVRVGVEGRPPLTVWEHPNHLPNAMLDDDIDLRLDFALPVYASAHWPPSERNLWYMEVADDSPGPAGEEVGQVLDTVLVQRLPLSGGALLPVMHRSSGHGFPIVRGRSVKVYIPTRVSQLLRLGASPTSVAAGGTVNLSGSLFRHYQLTSRQVALIPFPGQHTMVFRTGYDPIEQTIVEAVIGESLTAQDGSYSVTYTPTATANYQAMAVTASGTTLATSPLVKVTVA